MYDNLGGFDAARLRLPPGVLGEIALPSRHPGGDPAELAAQALAAPIASPPLEALVRRGMRAAVIVDDYTRQTPLAALLPLVLRRLHAGGLAPGDIRIVIAPGSHRPMTPAELNDRLGPAAAGYTVTQTASTDLVQMVPAGATPGGIPVWLSRAAAEADFRLGLGLITPHMDAGFSGGCKLVLPGVCAEATINAFHARLADIPRNLLGEAESPLRLELEGYVMGRGLLDFIVNAIPAAGGGCAAVVAGHPVAAQRAGAQQARQAWGAPARRRYPLVLADCSPYDHDLWQSMKGLWAGDRLTTDGGRLIVVSRAVEAAGQYSQLVEDLGRDPDELLAALRAGRAADPKSAATAIAVGRMRRRIRLSLVAPGLGVEAARRAGFDAFDSPEAALQQALAGLPAAEQPRCLGVLPLGGTSLPVVEGGSSGSE
jgi:nickel-dependent lactate racemase